VKILRKRVILAIYLDTKLKFSQNKKWENKKENKKIRKRW